MKNEYEQWLYDFIITNKLNNILDDPAYQALNEKQKSLQRELEDQITGAQRKLFRQQEELAVQISNLEVEQVFTETLALSRALFFGKIS